MILGYNDRDLSKLRHELISETELDIFRKRKYKNRNNYTCWNRERYILAQCDICSKKYWRPSRYRPERNPKFWKGELTTSYKSKHCYSKECKNILNGLQQKKYTFENPTTDNHGYPQFSIGNGKYKKCHVYVMEQHIGKDVDAEGGEVIHHIDMDKLNYDISNLWLCDRETHAIAHESHNRCCRILMKTSGQLIFDRDMGKYYVINNNNKEQ